METKIIFLTNIPFMKHHYRDMYVEEISKKYIVDLWDLSILYNSSYIQQGISDFNEAKKIDTITSFENLIKETLSSYVPIVITNILNRNLGKVYNILKKYNIPIVCINKESFATSLEYRGKIHYLRYFDLRSQLSSIGHSLPIVSTILEKRTLGKFQYDYLIGGHNYFPVQSKRFLKIHQIKYDEYLKASLSEDIIKKKYILYIGSAPSSHPAYIGKPNTLNHKEYLKTLNTYLRKVEEDTGLEVVISGHPKGSYNEEEFGNRQILIGNTAELIHYSEGVICHFSTSLVNAVLEYKPMQIIYNSTILRSSFANTMVSGLELGRICKADICDLNNYHKWEMKMNKSAYNKFLEDEIINTEHPDKNNAELIRQYLEEIK